MRYSSFAALSVLVALRRTIASALILPDDWLARLTRQTYWDAIDAHQVAYEARLLDARSLRTLSISEPPSSAPHSATLLSNHSIVQGVNNSNMADPLSVGSAVIGLIAVSCQASKALRDTIHSYQNHTKTVRDLKNELEALEETLQVLNATVLSLDGANGVDFAALESPLRRCGCACEEFRQILEKCTGRNDDDKSNFRGWLKIRWMGSDINGFKDTLAGYKSTVAIAIAGVNL